MGAPVDARGSGMVGTVVQKLRVAAWAALGLVFAAPAAVAQVLDVPISKQMTLHHPATEVMERIYNLHDALLILITVITLFVLGLLVLVMVKFHHKRNPVPSTTTHHTGLEIAWTVIPIVILMALVVPSWRLLKYSHSTNDYAMTIKVESSQWYWTYKYPDQGDLVVESRMLDPKTVQDPRLKLLAVDNEMIVPIGTNIRILITSTDVMHSFTVPSFGVKSDAMIGRLNETWFNVREVGTYYGQCSQICGMNHAYMPIAVKAVTKADFDKWVADKKKTAGVAAPVQAAQAIR
jgi:cytochrome c oxidase subunit 2